MRKRIVALFIVFIALAIVSAYIAKQYFIQTVQEQTLFPIEVIENNFSNPAGSVNFETSPSDDDTMISLLHLRGDETLIGVVSQDFDGDGYDDQVNAIKTVSSPYISLLVGLYNPQTNDYERNATIATQVVQSNTFSFTGMDLTGDHRTALVYQGFKESGDAVLKAFFVSKNHGEFSLRQIADFTGDGSIFIQQVDRYDAYDRSRANGASFPIWVYTSDSENPQSMDQLQICYDWDASSGTYEKTKQVRVAGVKIAQQVLEQIQDGNVETFAAFLNGLWHRKYENEDYYIFFDYDSSEVVFFKQEEEVYNWTRSNLRRNGIYLSTVNQEIENLQRLIDISLRNVDEINIRIRDDVRMLISETNLWDGPYKKLSPGSSAGKTASVKKTDFIKILEENASWKMADDTSVIFSKGAYTASGDIVNDSGLYTKVRVLDNDYIQFRSSTASPLFKGMYMISYLSSDNENALVFVPYKVLPDGAHPSEEKSIMLTR